MEGAVITTQHLSESDSELNESLSQALETLMAVKERAGGEDSVELDEDLKTELKTILKHRILEENSSDRQRFLDETKAELIAELQKELDEQEFQNAIQSEFLRQARKNRKFHDLKMEIIRSM